MKILEMNDTFIKAGLSGGLPGEYEVEIIGNEMISHPSSAGATIFKYEIVIESISASEGSPNGGTVLIIEGKNFSPEDQENLIFVGNKPNTFCELISYSETQLVCVTPEKP